MSGVVDGLHLLDERDETYLEDQYDSFRRWRSKWFPFQAWVQKDAGKPDVEWRITLLGSPYCVAEGKTETRAKAFQAVADAKRDALARLREQLSMTPLVAGGRVE